MNAELLSQLMQATVALSLALTLVLLARKPLRHWLGARAAYFVWLLAPMSLLAVLMPAPDKDSGVATLATAVIAVSQPVADAIAPATGSAWPLWLLSTWLLGTMVAILLFSRQQNHFNRRVVRRGHEPFDEVDGHGPAVSGVFWPRIVLPADFRERYSTEEQALVLAHEQAHVSRGDIKAQALTVVLRTVFWFNPLVHLAAARFRFDQELACDATVLALFPDARRTYGEAMLKTQLAELGLPIGCYWQSSHPLRERITMLKSSLPSTRRRQLAQSGLVAACLITAGAVWAAQAPTTATSLASAANDNASVATMPSLTNTTAAQELAPPAYPTAASGETGTVVLKVLVGADGLVKDIKVEKTEVSDALVKAAIKAAYGWKFNPASRSADGKKVDGWVRVPVRFELSDKAAPGAKS